MKMKKNRNIKITFSDAMNKIDQSRDYNEYSEINSSAYFRDTMNNAEDEINKMMSSPLISNYKKFKRSKKVYQNMIKKNKEYMMKKLLLLNDNTKEDKEKQKEKAKIKKKNKRNEIYDRLSKIKINFSNYKKNELSKEKNGTQKVLLTTGNVPFFPKINKNYKGTASYKKLKSVQNHNERFLKTNLDKNRFLSRISDKSLMNSEDNQQKFFKRNYLRNMYDDCIKEIENFELQSQEKKDLKDLKVSANTKLEKPKLFGNNLYNEDTSMNKYLIENINKFNQNNHKKKVNIAKQLEDIRLKRDPILKLSEKFAYMNRKPLLTLFSSSNNEEEKNKVRKNPLIDLKIKDDLIMKNLEKDNRNKNLLLKRLEEDQIKYKKQGYFFMTMENDDELNKVIYKSKENEINKSIDIGHNILIKSNDMDNMLYKSSCYESQRNMLYK